MNGYTNGMESCELLTALLLRTEVYWDVTPSTLVNCHRLLGRPQFPCPKGQLSRLLRLLDPEDECITPLQNIGNYLPIDNT